MLIVRACSRPSWVGLKGIGAARWLLQVFGSEEAEGVKWSSVAGGWKRFQAQSGRADDVVVGFRNRPLGFLQFDSAAVVVPWLRDAPACGEEALDRLQGLDNFVERLGLISDAAGLRGTGHVSRRPMPRSGRLQLRDGRRHVD